jgi:hypothetical protein
MPILPLLEGWLDLDMLPQTFTEPIISLNSLIARKKLKNGLIIGLEPEQPLSKLSWLRTGLKDSNSEGFLAWVPLAVFPLYVVKKKAVECLFCCKFFCRNSAQKQKSIQ